MTTPASISPPKPAASLKGPGARRNSCRRTLPILTPLSTAGFPSNNASENTCLSTTAICIRQLTPCSSNNRHLSGKDYTSAFVLRNLNLTPETTPKTERGSYPAVWGQCQSATALHGRFPLLSPRPTGVAL